MKRPALGSLGLFALTAALIVTTGCGTKKKTGRLACQVDTTCPSGSLCVDNNCVTTQTCSQTSDCSGGGKCINSICWNVTCSDANPCAQGQCMEGVCVTRAGEVDASNDGTSSEDATSSDQKTGGETACSSSADCTNAFSDLGVCEQALCQDGICVRRPKLAGTSCDDGKFCTEGDECNEKGECVGQQKDCSASGDQCNAGVCDETTKSCTTVPKPDTTPCDDGSYCTINDRCDGQGQCGGDPRDCSASGDQCNSGVCDEDSKSCVKTPKSDTTPCDDGKFCTTNDTCDGQGQCLGGPIRNCAGLGNACNEGYCDLDKDSCQTRPLAKGKPCEDGKYCTINDTCDGAGTCVAGEPRNCATTNSCIAGVCDEATKQCGIPKPFGTPCKLPDTEFAMCGLFTDCRPWTSVEYQFPATGEVQLIDWARFCFSPD
ncbi:MAG: hypothetical protein KC609_00590, partial [Myxococcales bacterium]|nr:hypothetical protein [Myxococcales bacterium]